MALSNSQHDTIMREYEQKQLRNRDIQNRRYAQICEKLPELRAIDDTISALSLQQAKKLLAGDKDALSSLKEELHILSDSKRRLLISNGYPEDYLDPIFTCRECHDTGYVEGRKCRCFKQAELSLLYEQSNLGEILKRENFDTFSLDYYSPNFIDKVSGKSSRDQAAEALDICRSFAKTFDQSGENLLLYGTTGVGKTFLTHCIAKEAIDRIHSVIYLTASGLLEILRAKQFRYEEDDVPSYSDSLYDCDLLIIDDLGTELQNSFTVSQLFICLNERILRKKSTIISTNLSLNDVKSIYSERIFSRISSNYTILKLTGDDIRIKKKLMNMEAN